jgi:hypothetical protein
MFATKNLKEETEKLISLEDAITAWSREELLRLIVQMMTKRTN